MNRKVTLIVVSSPKATENRDQFVEWAVDEGYDVLVVAGNGRNESLLGARAMSIVGCFFSRISPREIGLASLGIR